MLINNYENFIYSYITKKIQEEHPEITANAGDPLFDLFINPLITLFKPYVDLVNRLDLIQDLSNAALMTEDELDMIGLGNYGIARNPGARASGYVYVSMNPDYVTEKVIIGPITVTNNKGLRYSNAVSTIIKYNEDDSTNIPGTIIPGLAADYFNATTGKYEFPIFVEAEEAGTLYNAEPNTITTLGTKYPLLDPVVSNKEDFSNGFDKESNDKYAERIINSLFIKNIGVGIGYKSYVLAKFGNVKDVYVARYMDPVMERDKIIVREYGHVIEKHIGGKVDLYLRGNYYDTYDNVGYINSDKIRLVNPNLKSSNSIVVRNLTNINNNDLKVLLRYEFPDTKTGWVEAAVSAGPSAELPDIGDELEFSYFSYLDDSFQDYFLYKQTLYYMVPKIRLHKTPFESVVGMTVYSAQDPTVITEVSPVDEAITIQRNFPVVERGTCAVQDGLGADQVCLDPHQAVAILDYYKGMSIELVSGTGDGQKRTITGFNTIGNICTLDSDWTVVPDITTSYVIRNNTNYKEESAEDEIDVIIDTTYTIEGVPVFNDGDMVVLSYTYNKLVYDVQRDIYLEENRVITTDVLAREGKPLYLYFGFGIKCNPGTTIGQEEKLIISSLLEDILQTTNFGASIHTSDIIGKMYRHQSIITFLDYIQLPIVFFGSEYANLYFNHVENTVSLTDGGGVYEPLNESNIFLLQGSDYYASRLTLDSASYPVTGFIAVKAVD